VEPVLSHRRRWEYPNSCGRLAVYLRQVDYRDSPRQQTPTAATAETTGYARAFRRAADSAAEMTLAFSGLLSGAAKMRSRRSHFSNARFGVHPV
jgi:hypothetical protein